MNKVSRFGLSSSIGQLIALDRPHLPVGERSWKTDTGYLTENPADGLTWFKYKNILQLSRQIVRVRFNENQTDGDYSTFVALYFKATIIASGQLQSIDLHHC
jgi:hypothetical protein